MEGIRHRWRAGEPGARTRTAVWIGIGCLGITGLLARFALPVAIAAALTLLGLTVAAAWPFAGLLLFVGLVYLRPEDTFPELVGLRLVLLIGGGLFGIFALRTVSARHVPQWSSTAAW